jgi:hypothetical protein
MKECFVISPIGPEGSDIRKDADDVFEYIIKPAMEECNIHPFRSDHLQKPGRISEQMFTAIHSADLCIADLTGYNPNVFYEVAVAQSANRPVILLIRKGQTLPFDVGDFRCVSYDLNIRSFQERTHIKNVVTHIKEFEATGWRVPNLFGNYRASTNSEPEVIDFEDIKVQKEKTVIYKMLNLKSVSETAELIYEKYIPRINQKIGVSSEFMTIRINKFDKMVKYFKSLDRTNGTAIELNSLLPFELNLEDTGKKAQLIEPVVVGPSNVYVAINHAYNGFKVGNLDLSTKAERNTEMVRLIVDFSSVPNYDHIISDNPKLFYSRFKRGVEERVDREHQYQLVSPGVFQTAKTNMKTEEVLRFEFAMRTL